MLSENGPSSSTLTSMNSGPSRDEIGTKVLFLLQMCNSVLPRYILKYSGFTTTIVVSSYLLTVK